MAVYLEQSEEEMKAEYRSAGQLSESEIENEVRVFTQNVTPVLDAFESQGLLRKVL